MSYDELMQTLGRVLCLPEDASYGERRFFARVVLLEYLMQGLNFPAMLNDDMKGPAPTPKRYLVFQTMITYQKEIPSLDRPLRNMVNTMLSLCYKNVATAQYSTPANFVMKSMAHAQFHAEYASAETTTFAKMLTDLDNAQQLSEEKAETKKFFMALALAAQTNNPTLRAEMREYYSMGQCFAARMVFFGV